jgi:hypothetical protein
MRAWIVTVVPPSPATPTTQDFGSDSEAARTEYIRQLTLVSAPQDQIDAATNAQLTQRTTLQYTDPASGTRVILTTRPG